MKTYDASVEAKQSKSLSIYRAFGSKEALVRETVTPYCDTVGSATLRALNGDLSARAAVEVLLKENIQAFTSSDPARGRSILVDTVHVAGDNTEKREFSFERRREVRGSFLRRFVRAVEDGELPRGTDIEALAALHMTFLSGLSLQAMDGVPRDILFKAVDHLMANWPSRAILRSNE